MTEGQTRRSNTCGLAESSRDLLGLGFLIFSTSLRTIEGAMTIGFCFALGEWKGLIPSALLFTELTLLHHEIPA